MSFAKFVDEDFHYADFVQHSNTITLTSIQQTLTTRFAFMRMCDLSTCIHSYIALNEQRFSDLQEMISESIREAPPTLAELQTVIGFQEWLGGSHRISKYEATAYVNAWLLYSN